MLAAAVWAPTVAKSVIGPATLWIARQAGRWINPQIQAPDRATIDAAALWFAEQLVATDLGANPIVTHYAVSPEFSTLFRQILLFKLTGRPLQASGPLLEAARVGASLYLTTAPQDSDLESFLRLAIGMAELVTMSARPDQQKTQDALDAQVGAIAVEQYLASIDSQLRRLGVSPNISRQDLDAALLRYRLSARKVYGKIQPPNTEGVAPVPLNELYVMPSLTIEENESSGEASLSDLLSMPRCVVLGDPGGGKSTLTKKLAFDLLTGEGEGEARLLPIVITLRDYGATERRSQTSVTEYIVEQLRTIHQIHLTREAVEWGLNTGQFYVIFDGLDELLQADSRQRIANVIDAFEAVYPTSNILVTSRRVGYRQAPLDKDVFKTVQLGDLDDEQVDDYVRKWFSTQAELPSAKRAELANGFLRDSALVTDLRRNPLMLALMCTIYRSEAYIPRNRPEVYEKCSRMLFDKWDRHRGLLEPFEFEAHIEPALMYIAHEIYGDSEAQTGVTEHRLIQLATDYLRTWQFGDQAKAEHAAREFVSFCRGRAWVFSDVGLNVSEESIYQFTHRTFLEYFTASHLARIEPTVDSLCTRLLPMVAMNEWDVVGQLAIQVKTRGLQGGPDEAVSHILRAANDAKTGGIEGSRTNLLAFLSRSTSFLLTSPAITRTAVRTIVACVFDDSTYPATSAVGRTEGLDIHGNAIEAMAGSLLAPLLKAARETRPIVVETLVSSLTNILTSGNGLALEFAAHYAWTLAGSSDLAEYHEMVSESRDVALDTIRAHEADWPWGNVVRSYAGDMPFERLCDLVGHHATVLTTPIVGGASRYIPPAMFALNCMLQGNCTSNGNFTPDEIENIVMCAARLLVSDPPPERTEISLALLGSTGEDPSHDEHPQYPMDALIAAACVLTSSLGGSGTTRSQATALFSGGLGHLEPLRSTLTGSGTERGVAPTAPEAVRWLELIQAWSNSEAMTASPVIATMPTDLAGG